MVIDSNNGINPANTGNARARAAAGGTGGREGGAGEADSRSREDVVLSPAAQSLARLEAQIQTATDVDGDKVAAIKQAIENGRFEINAERIADRLLQQDDLLG